VQQGETLKVFQAEAAFGPGKVALNGSAGSGHQTLPLFEEEQGCRLTFAFAAAVVMHGGMGVEPIVNHPEHTPIKVVGIGIHHLHAEAKEQSRDQHPKPTDLGVMRMGRG